MITFNVYVQRLTNVVILNSTKAIISRFFRHWILTAELRSHYTERFEFLGKKNDD